MAFLIREHRGWFFKLSYIVSFINHVHFFPVTALEKNAFFKEESRRVNMESRHVWYNSSWSLPSQLGKSHIHFSVKIVSWILMAVFALGLLRRAKQVVKSIAIENPVWPNPYEAVFSKYEWVRAQINRDTTRGEDLHVNVICKDGNCSLL